MTDRELDEKLLEALEHLNRTGDTQVFDLCYAPELIPALQARLAREEQEPVAWELRKGKTDRVLVEITNNPKRAHDWKCSLEEVVPLYTAPQPAVPDEVLAAIRAEGLTLVKVERGYRLMRLGKIEAQTAATEQPAREWVGLTVDCLGLALDLEAQAKRVESQTVERAMLAAAHGLRIIEAKLREKNG